MVESINDIFGIKKIYHTNTHPNRAKPWLLGIDDWEERRYNGTGDWDNYSISTENNYVLLNFVNDPLISGHIKGRFPILALRYDQYTDLDGNLSYLFTEKDQSKLRKRSFMGTLNDWKNVEVTLYMKVKGVANSGVRHMAISARGGPHHSNGGFFGISPCWGTALYVGLSFIGEPDIAKELCHGDYTDGISLPSVTGDVIQDRWIGMKGVFYTKTNGNPYIELWVDKNADNDWELVQYQEDAGSWFIREQNEIDHPILKNKCGGTSDEKITWGGPGVIFKLDGLTRVDIKWASVREILPPEGWPIRYLLNARSFPFPASMRSLANEHGLINPISLRELTQREAELYPFS